MFFGKEFLLSTCACSRINFVVFSKTAKKLTHSEKVREHWTPPGAEPMEQWMDGCICMYVYVHVYVYTYMYVRVAHEQW